MKKKKLLLVGSDSIHVYNYYNLINDYFDEILVISHIGNSSYNYPNLKTVNFSVKNPLQVRGTVKRIAETIAGFNPSVIHIHQAGTYSYLTLKAAENFNIPTIVTTWGSDILQTPNMGLLYRQMLRYVLKRADFFTSDSLHVASEMQRIAGIRELDITIANFGITPNELKVEKEKIIYSNRLHSELYRIDKIIKAFIKFSDKKENEGWKLIIAGKGNETEKLKRLAQESGISDKIEFVGWLDSQKNSEYYSKAKIYISIPKSDGTALSLLEAMNAGCIPVVANLPANIEWIMDGINGVIVNNLDSDFIERAFNIDVDKAVKMNEEIIGKKGTKEANKSNFIGLYNRCTK